MLRIGATQRYYDPLAEGINDIQELSKTHEMISKAKTEILHRIQTHYLPLYFPEIRTLPKQQPQRMVSLLFSTASRSPASITRP